MCSAPVRENSVFLCRAGAIFHLHCMGRADQLRAARQIGRAPRTRTRSRDVLARARARRTKLTCAICGDPIIRGVRGWSRTPGQPGGAAHLACLQPRGYSGAA